MYSEYEIKNLLNLENNELNIYIITSKNIYYNDDSQLEQAYLHKKKAIEYVNIYDKIFSDNDMKLDIDEIKISIKITGQLYIIYSNNKNYIKKYNLQNILSMLE